MARLLYTFLRLALVAALLYSLPMPYSPSIMLGSAFAARPVRRVLPSPAFKLPLTSIDFGFPNETFFQGLQRALHRSSLRLKHFQRVTSNPRGMAKDGVSFEIPVSTKPSGFITTLAIGTPPVNFTAVIDTGSDLVWRQCLPCVQCYEQDSPVIFDPSNSSTYQLASCNDTLCSALSGTSCSTDSSSNWSDAPSCSYTYGYDDKSATSGDFSYDTLTLPDLAGQPQSLFHFGFGCAHYSANPDFEGAGGLVGFGRGPASLPSQLNTPKFSYCLQPASDSASLTSPLFLGAAAEIQSVSPTDSVLTTPLISNPSIPTFYYVGLKQISVGEKSLGIPPGTFDIREDGSGGMIFDSGTTLTRLAAEAYDVVASAFKASIPFTPVDGSNLGFELCYNASSVSKLNTAPPLTFHFDGADMQLPPSNYFVSASDNLVCLALERSEDNFSIYGNIQQQNFHILYDLEANLLSFTPAACDTL